MSSAPAVTVVRLGHRPGRDERTTTHVALVARAFGAARVVVPTSAGHVADTVADVSERFGGGFEVQEVDSPLGWLRGESAPVVHLTMYGLPVQAVVDAVAGETADGPLLVAVGAGKVPGEVYDLADWNVAVTNQPHSEIAALAVWLDRLTDGAALEAEWSGGTHTVVPTECGKRVEPDDGGESG